MLVEVIIVIMMQILIVYYSIVLLQNIKMKSLIVTANDTYIAKTKVCAGIANSLKKSGI